MELTEAIELRAKAREAGDQVSRALPALAEHPTEASSALSLAEAALARVAALAADLVTDCETAIKAAADRNPEDEAFVAGHLFALLASDSPSRSRMGVEFRDGGLLLHPFAVPGSYQVRLVWVDPDSERF